MMTVKGAPPRIARLPSSFLDYPSQRVLPGDVTNKKTALQEIDRVLGYDGPPALEYIVVEETQGGIPGLPYIPVGFGHAVLRYRLPSGAQRIANITKSGRLCEFWESPADYIFGSDGGKHGMFARQMYSIRIQEWDDSSIMAMHHFLCAINASKDATRHHGANRRETAVFDLTGAFTSFVGFLGGAKMVAAGNCSNWTSKAMHLAGLVDRPHTLPKSVFIDMFEEFVIRQECPDAKVVVYLQSEAGKLSPTPTDPSQRRTPQRFNIVHGMCSPFMPLRQYTFWDIYPYADAVVRIDDTALFHAIGRGLLHLEEGEVCGGVGGLVPASSSGCNSAKITQDLAQAGKELARAKKHITAHAVPGPGLRPGWYRYALRWRMHTFMVGACVVVYLFAGFPHSDSPWSALLARVLLSLLGLIVHAAFA